MREYLLVFLVAGAVTYLLTVVAREVALRTNAVAMVRDRDVHDVPIPYGGGLAMLGGLVAAYLVARRLPFLSRGGDYMFHTAGMVIVAGALICAVGILDDIFELDALTKLGGQIVAAGILILNGIAYVFVTMPDHTQVILEPTQGQILAAGVVVATVNAVNFVDGLDGLAAGVIGLGAVAFFFFCYQVANLNGVTLATTGALLSAALAGACAGFLPHNFHQARLFMGDSGSMLIGLVLSSSSLSLTGQFAASDLTQQPGDTRLLNALFLLPLVVPLSITVVPLLDLVLAVLRRTRAGRSPFAPDKQHLHHRMLEFGHSHRRAVLIMWSWAALVGFGMVLVSLYRGPLMWALLAVMVALTVAATFVLPRVRSPHLLDADAPQQFGRE